MELSKELLESLFEYKDGGLYWKQCKGFRNRHIGQKAGYIATRADGYKCWVIRIKNKQLLEHRIIFMLHHGYMPKEIDHINNNSLNNKIENLREASTTENQQNATVRTDNTSGIKGVSWDKRNKKWKVQAKVNGKPKYFGLYADIELADLVAQEARNKYHGEFARHR